VARQICNCYHPCPQVADSETASRYIEVTCKISRVFADEYAVTDQMMAVPGRGCSSLVVVHATAMKNLHLPMTEPRRGKY